MSVNLDEVQLPADANLMFAGRRRNVILQRRAGNLVWAELVPLGPQLSKPLGFWTKSRHIEHGHVDLT